MLKMMKFRFLMPVFLLLTSDLQAKSYRVAKTHNVAWDPRFTQELEFGSQKNLQVHIGEYMEIFCPQYDADAPNTLKFIIYNVSFKAFQECTRPQDAKKIFSCNQPSISKKLTTKFQRRSPNPLGFIFRPGHTYYYMAEPLDRLSAGGHPCDDVMRLSIDVRPKKVHHHQKATSRKTTTSIATTTSTVSSTKAKPTSTSTLLARITSTITAKTPEGASQLVQGSGGGGSASHVQRSLTLISIALISSWLLLR